MRVCLFLNAEPDGSMKDFPTPTWQSDDGTVMLYYSDCQGILQMIPSHSIDACVTDPPYEIGFIGFGWDQTGIAFNPALWKSCLSVLKPGAHLLAFSAARTYHRIAVAIEDAGFEIRDQIMWLYGSGFPKSFDISKGIDRHYKAEREVIGSTGYKTSRGHFRATKWGGGDRTRVDLIETKPATEEAKKWEGWGTTLKPAHEPIVVARRPFDGTVIENVLRYGTGGLNIESGKIPPPDGECAGTRDKAGRFPANVMHDGSEDVLKIFGDAARFFYCAKASQTDRQGGNEHPTVKPNQLMRYLVRLVTPPGGIVLDPFMGSGSTGVACVQSGFQFIGIEKEKNYFGISVERIQQEIKHKQFSLFE